MASGNLTGAVPAGTTCDWPALDPSGTSWLPFPFWANGAAMMAFGRSLGTAGVVAWVFGLASVLVGYAALFLALGPHGKLQHTEALTARPLYQLFQRQFREAG